MTKEQLVEEIKKQAIGFKKAFKMWIKLVFLLPIVIFKFLLSLLLCDKFLIFNWWRRVWVYVVLIIFYPFAVFASIFFWGKAYDWLEKIKKNAFETGWRIL